QQTELRKQAAVAIAASKMRKWKDQHQIQDRAEHGVEEEAVAQHSAPGSEDLAHHRIEDAGQDLPGGDVVGQLAVPVVPGERLVQGNGSTIRILEEVVAGFIGREGLDAGNVTESEMRERQAFVQAQEQGR